MLRPRIAVILIAVTVTSIVVLMKLQTGVKTAGPDREAIGALAREPSHEVSAQHVEMSASISSERLTKDEAREGGAQRRFSVLPEGIEVSQKSDASGRIFGRWTGPGGAGLAHQRVRVFRLDSSGTVAGHLVVPTDHSGAYAAHVAPADYRVGFGNRSYVIEVHSREERELNHHEASGATVRVRVAGNQTQPANALITMKLGDDDHGVQRVQARTSADGIATFSSVQAGRGLITGELYRREGGRPLAARTTVDVPSEGEIEVTLAPHRGRLNIRVVENPSGEGVYAAEVEVIPDGSRRALGSIVTAADGRGATDGMPEGAAVLRVRHRDFSPKLVRAMLNDNQGELVVHFDRGKECTVLVTDDKDKPMAIMLRARTLGEIPSREWEWRLDENGRGRMDRVPLEATEIEFLAAGCEAIRANTSSIASDGFHKLTFKRRPVEGK